MTNKKILEELNQIAERNGMLKPQAVVAFARNPKTALHKHFTWNDGEAADQWRLHEARMLNYRNL